MEDQDIRVTGAVVAHAEKGYAFVISLQQPDGKLVPLSCSEWSHDEAAVVADGEVRMNRAIDNLLEKLGADVFESTDHPPRTQAEAIRLHHHLTPERAFELN